ncbi:branched-chain amino acid ABC transporter permease [Lactobacillus parabuchneri]|uniref:Branched-chain amino acid ABC transporter permease n=1 Tax=Lentilactobacillus parabuchneri TaxID=152331 RepID=A0A844EMG2_9LACO|nr:branched-chain amino acid ABC transporter permease [Lentilactobacillus parabuchneri]
MQTFFQQIINGLSLGSIYALLALGYTMVYGIIKLINFAHGDIYMLGAFWGYYVINVWHFNFISALLSAMLVGAASGVIIEYFAYRPLRHAPRITALITAIGVSFLLENGMSYLFTSNTRNFPQIIKQVNNINWTISFTFALGSSLAGAAGVLIGLYYNSIDPLMGMTPGIKAFVAAVLGGIGSVPGASVGGFIIGILETFVQSIGLSAYKDAVVYFVLIVILLILPAGIFGKNTKEKV